MRARRKCSSDQGCGVADFWGGWSVVHAVCADTHRAPWPLAVPRVRVSGRASCAVRRRRAPSGSAVTSVWSTYGVW
eukprot:6472429-Prymnesium_polylepis.1